MTNLDWTERAQVGRGRNWGCRQKGGMNRSAGYLPLASRSQVVVQRNGQEDEGVQILRFMPEYAFILQSLTKPLQRSSLKHWFIPPRIRRQDSKLQEVRYGALSLVKGQ